MKKVLASLSTLALLAACNTQISPSAPGDSAPSAEPTMFEVVIEAPADAPGPLSPGIYVIHRDGMPIFTANMKDRGQGLEGIAEDGNPANAASLNGAQVFNTPMGDSEPGPATPGKKYIFTFEASPGDRLSFATMYVQSNDGFYAPADTGIPLFNGDTPINGDMTAKVMLWDSGTEVNQEPVNGADQAPRQSGPNTGTSESETIQLISERDDFDYPNNIRLTINAK